MNAKRRLTPEGYAKLLHKPVRFRCKQRGESVDITPADILAVWPKDNRCPVFGTPFRFGPVNYADRTAIPSVDRIDAKRGYVRGNIAVISWRANVIKNDATLEDLQRLVRWLKKIT